MLLLSVFKIHCIKRLWKNAEWLISIRASMDCCIHITIVVKRWVFLIKNEWWKMLKKVPVSVKDTGYLRFIWGNPYDDYELILRED